MNIEEIISEKDTTLFRALDELGVVSNPERINQLNSELTQLGQNVFKLDARVGRNEVDVRAMQLTVDDMKKSVDSAVSQVQTLNVQFGNLQKSLNSSFEALRQLLNENVCYGMRRATQKGVISWVISNDDVYDIKDVRSLKPDEQKYQMEVISRVAKISVKSATIQNETQCPENQSEAQ